MRIGVTLRILGTLLVFFSATLVPPSIVSIIYQDGLLITFGQAGITIFIVGAVLMTIFKQFANELRTKDGFLVTALCYFALGAFSALPLVLNPALDMSWVDAWFESFSGLTTTGATVMTGLISYRLPSCITDNNYNGLGAWASLCLRSRFCPCWA